MRRSLDLLYLAGGIAGALSLFAIFGLIASQVIGRQFGMNLEGVDDLTAFAVAGSALLPLLEAEDRVGRVVGVARSEFDPDERGWSKLTYRRGDVRRPEDLREAFEGADVVVHLAFLIVGSDPATTRAINVEGTLNTFRAAARAGVSRFVYASSVAAYGFHRDNPLAITEDETTVIVPRGFMVTGRADGCLDIRRAP